MINGHPVIVTETTAATPPQLLDIRDAFRTWLPLHRKLYIGARFTDAFTRPRTDLSKVWPQFARWMITDEVYGVQQFLPQNLKLLELVQEVLKLLDIEAGDDTVPEERTLELQQALLPWGERLTSKDHVAAGAAWQVIYNSLLGHAPIALRYYCLANKMGQDTNDSNVAMIASVESSLRKVFELLKL